MKNIIVFGPPGTGKGTQSKRLAAELGLKHISTGDIIRKNQDEGTELGKLADQIINDGNLLPDSVVDDMMDDVIKSNPDVEGFIFDGYPRTLAQAVHLDEFLTERGTPISRVLLIESRFDVIKKRLIERGKEHGRKDDNERVIRHRFKVYREETKRALSQFIGRDLIRNIDGNRPIELVYKQIISEL